LCSWLNGLTSFVSELMQETLTKLFYTMSCQNWHQENHFVPFILNSWFPTPCCSFLLTLDQLLLFKFWCRISLTVTRQTSKLLQTKWGMAARDPEKQLHAVRAIDLLGERW